MEDWKDRLKAEYIELKVRLEKLHKFNVKKEAAFRLRKCGWDTIDEDQNRGLLLEQEETMTRYLHILELRAEINGIELKP